MPEKSSWFARACSATSHISNDDHCRLPVNNMYLNPMNLSPLVFALNAVSLMNVLWFGAGAIYFGLTPASATKLLISRPARQSPLFKTVSASVRFLGGMNFAFAILSGVLLLNQGFFPEARQMALLTSVLALAHGTQFAANIPVAIAGRGQGESPWPVLSGRMLFIFLMDFTLMLANSVVAVFLCGT